MEKLLVVVLDIIQVMLHDGGNKRCAIKKRKGAIIVGFLDVSTS